MKNKVCFALIVVISAFSFSACSFFDSYSAKKLNDDTYFTANISSEKAELSDCKFISIEENSKKAYYNDGIISFSWNTEDWYLGLYNNIPCLSKTYNGLRLSFAVIGRDKGIADDFDKYTIDCTEKYFCDDGEIPTIANMLPSVIDDYYSDKGYICQRTGYYDVLEKFDENVPEKKFSIIRSLTDGNNSAIICISVMGFTNSVKKEKNNNFSEGVYNGRLDEAADDILSSLEFVKEE